MQRRGFLALLIAAPFVPALLKVDQLAAALEAPELEAIGPEIRWVTRYAMSLSTRVLVEPGRIERLSILPQRPFLADRLVVSPTSERFDILNVSAAGEPQLGDEMPAELFSSRQFGVRHYFDAIRPGEEIVMAVRNRGDEPAHFNAVFMGSLGS